MMIKELTELEIPGVLELIKSFRNEQDRNLSKTDLDSISNSLINITKSDSSFVFVAIDQQVILGYIAIHILDFPLIAGKECYISDLIINKNSRGNGIGAKLLDRVELYSSENQVKRLMLNNHKEEESYQRSFYTKKGFTERKTFANFMKSL